MTSPSGIHPGAVPTDVTAQVDAVLTARVSRTADVLAGLLAAGTLARTAQPEQLPHMQWPDITPETVQEIWNAGAAVGYWAGSLRSRARWDTTDLHQARQLLADAGYASMAALVARAADGSVA